MSRLYITFFICSILCFACGEKEDSGQPMALNEETGDPAIDAVIEEIRKDSTNAALYAKRGSLYYDRKVYTEAIRDFNKAVMLDSTKAEYFHSLADAYLENNNSHTALEVLEDAKKRFPGDIPTLLKLADFQLILKQYMDGLSNVNKVIEMKPQHAKAYYLKGLFYRDMGSNLQAMEAFQKAVELDPDLSDAYLLMGNMISEENPELALRFYDNALITDPEDVVALHHKALHLHQHGDLDEAMEVYKRIHVLDPRNSDAFYNAGLLYFEIDSIEKAENMFSIAIANDPFYPKAYYYRGETYRLQNDLERAKKDYEKAIELNPSYQLPREQLEMIEE